MSAVSASEREPSPDSSRGVPLWKKILPYAGTLLIFGLIFWRVPMAQVGEALAQAPLIKFVGVFLPFCLFYWIIDSLCLTWVIRRFNAPLRFRDILPIRASMYLVALINTNLGQGGVAWALHRLAKVPFLEILSSILFIGLMEAYQLFLFSTLGVLFYHPSSPTQVAIVHVLRIAYVIAWVALAATMILFAQARHGGRIRTWITGSRAGAVAETFLAARPLDYAIVLGIKAPSFLASVLAQYFALSLYGIAIPFTKLLVFLPLVFLAAALPVAVAHLGTSQAAWLLFFSDSAPGVKILAYSLAAHFTFMFCNGLIGLMFLPRATKELTALRAITTDQA